MEYGLVWSIVFKAMISNVIMYSIHNYIANHVYSIHNTLFVVRPHEDERSLTELFAGFRISLG